MLFPKPLKRDTKRYGQAGSLRRDPTPAQNAEAGVGRLLPDARAKSQWNAYERCAPFTDKKPSAIESGVGRYEAQPSTKACRGC